MKQFHCINLLILLLAIASFISCKDNDKEPGAGITGQSWTEGKSLVAIVGQTLSVQFTASSDWKASSSDSWCQILTPSGKSGSSTLQMLVSTTTNTPRIATITIKVEGYTSASFQVTQQVSSSPSTEEMELNGKVDAYLREKYLWNTEYNTLSLDFTKDYASFFYDALYSMKTNTLDKKMGSNNKYTLFSYIEKKNPIATKSTKLVDKELEYSFGIVGITPVLYQSGELDFCVQGVYPDSPAAEAGIKRGSTITKINGISLTENNYVNLLYDLWFPTAVSTKQLTLQISDTQTKQISVTSKAMYTNPVIFKQAKEISGHKIGYLVYSRFDAGFDEELLNAFKYLKSENITDLILDLRYNGGGHTISANLIATCIVGASSEGKVFTSYRYNDERMKKYNNERPKEYFNYSSYANLGTSLAEGALGLKQVYCLVGNNTASASELVINALKGIDINVTLIGEQTTGKNVGMEYTEFTVKNNTYKVVPITFQTYNAKGFGEYEKGFAPDQKLDENQPYNEAGIFYNFREYGTDSEFLYAAAVKMITGIDILPKTRSIGSTIKGKAYNTPQNFRLGHYGMLVKSKAE